jgi:transcriptional regulator with XRE-family HTH domain
MTDANIIRSIGDFVKHNRLQQNKTQVQLAKEAGLNPYTISQLENGVSVTLSTLIQLLRTLDELQVLEQFTIKEEISPIQYAKLKMKKRRRARGKTLEI